MDEHGGRGRRRGRGRGGARGNNGRQLQTFVYEGTFVYTPANYIAVRTLPVSIEALEAVRTIMSMPLESPLEGRERIPRKMLDPDRNDGPFCTVCLESCAGPCEVADISCGHIFHYECLQAWLAKQSTCPLCRADLSSSVNASDTEDRQLRRELPPLNRKILFQQIPCKHCAGSGHAHFECPSKPRTTRYF